MCSDEVLVGGIPVKVIKKTSLKNWYLRIFPPVGNVSISVPSSVSDDSIRIYLLKKLPEIKKAKERFILQERQSKREYVSGETYYLWGKTYKLQIVYEGRKASIRKTQANLVLTIPEGSTEEYKEKIIIEWYRRELKRVLPKVVSQCERRVGIKAEEYCVKNMRTLWGSCNRLNRRIWINLQLVKKPIACLEYVVTHELVHLLEKNHTPLFFSLVEKYCPYWKNAKRVLEELPLEYMAERKTGVKTI